MPGLTPPTFDRGPVSEPEDGSIELLDGSRVQFLLGVIEVIVRFNEVREGGIDDNRVRWVVGFTRGDDTFGPVEKLSALVGQPDRGALRRSHRICPFTLRNLECSPRSSRPFPGSPKLPDLGPFGKLFLILLPRNPRRNDQLPQLTLDDSSTDPGEILSTRVTGSIRNLRSRPIPDQFRTNSRRKALQAASEIDDSLSD